MRTIIKSKDSIIDIKERAIRDTKEISIKGIGMERFKILFPKIRDRIRIIRIYDSIKILIKVIESKLNTFNSFKRRIKDTKLKIEGIIRIGLKERGGIILINNYLGEIGEEIIIFIFLNKIRFRIMDINRMGHRIESSILGRRGIGIDVREGGE